MYSCLQFPHFPSVCLCVPATSQQQIFLLHIKITTTTRTIIYYQWTNFFSSVSAFTLTSLVSPLYRNTQMYYCMSFLLLTLLGLPCGEGLAEDDTLDPDRCRAPNE